MNKSMSKRTYGGNAWMEKGISSRVFFFDTQGKLLFKKSKKVKVKKQSSRRRRSRK